MEFSEIVKLSADAIDLRFFLSVWLYKFEHYHINHALAVWQRQQKKSELEIVRFNNVSNSIYRCDAC